MIHLALWFFCLCLLAVYWGIVGLGWVEVVIPSIKLGDYLGISFGIIFTLIGVWFTVTFPVSSPFK